MELLLLTFIGFMFINCISWVLEPFNKQAKQIVEYRTTNIYTDNSYHVNNTLNMERGLLNGFKEENTSDYEYTKGFGSERGW